MSNPFKSILGITVNDPTICIKGNGHFACKCPDCREERQEFYKFLRSQDNV